MYHANDGSLLLFEEVLILSWAAKTKPTSSIGSNSASRGTSLRSTGPYYTNFVCITKRKHFVLCNEDQEGEILFGQSFELDKLDFARKWALTLTESAITKNLLNQSLSYFLRMLLTVQDFTGKT